LIVFIDMHFWFYYNILESTRREIKYFLWYVFCQASFKQSIWWKWDGKIYKCFDSLSLKATCLITTIILY